MLDVLQDHHHQRSHQTIVTILRYFCHTAQRHKTRTITYRLCIRKYIYFSYIIYLHFTFGLVYDYTIYSSYSLTSKR